MAERRGLLFRPGGCCLIALLALVGSWGLMALLVYVVIELARAVFGP